MSTVALTGATGFLGGVILARLVEETDHDVIALIRAEDDEAGRARLSNVCQRLWGEAVPPRRVEALAADLERPGLGMDEPALLALAERSDAIVHSAASISFDMPLSRARETNVEGTRRVIELAHLARGRGVVARLIHVSTAYVAGERRGLVMEDELDIGQSFRNSYEQSKAEAEAMLAGCGLPAAIVRPSIIVGERESGWTSAFNVIYGPLRAFARGRLRTIPARGDGLVDLIPVDVVAGSVLSLLELRGATGAFHLASGDDAMTAAELASLVAAEMGVETLEFRPQLDGSLGEYTPYTDVACRFDTTRARELDIHAPPISDYLPDLLRFADSVAWGKRLLPRSSARAGRVACV